MISYVHAFVSALNFYSIDFTDIKTKADAARIIDETDSGFMFAPTDHGSLVFFADCILSNGMISTSQFDAYKAKAYDDVRSAAYLQNPHGNYYKIRVATDAEIDSFCDVHQSYRKMALMLKAGQNRTRFIQ